MTKKEDDLQFGSKLSQVLWPVICSVLKTRHLNCSLCSISSYLYHFLNTMHKQLLLQQFVRAKDLTLVISCPCLSFLQIIETDLMKLGCCWWGPTWRDMISSSKEVPWGRSSSALVVVVVGWWTTWNKNIASLHTALWLIIERQPSILNTL